MTRKKKKILVARDPNAKAMWGKCRHQVFRDQKKYSRKKKHPSLEEE